MPKEVDAITRLYDYLLWMIPKLDKFPRNQKFVLGYRVETTMLDILELLLDAAYSRKKQDTLKQANLKKLSRQYSEGSISLEKIQQCIQSWISHASHADTWKLRHCILDGTAFQRGLTRNAAGRFLEQQSG